MIQITTIYNKMKSFQKQMRFLLFTASIFLSDASTTLNRPIVVTTKQLSPIDLSFQYNHDVSTLVKEFSNDLDVSVNNSGPCSVEVDVSSSALLDGGACALINILQEHQQNYTTKENRLILQLSMRMNGITAAGASNIFSDLLELNSYGKISINKVANETDNPDANDAPGADNELNIGSEANNTVTSTNDHKSENSTNYTLGVDSTVKKHEVEKIVDETDENIQRGLEGSISQSENSSNDTQNENMTAIDQSIEPINIHEIESPPADIMRIRVDSLDLAFNDLSQKKESKSMNGSLRKLIESEISCPQSLKLDRCNLGPPTCRSIAKGIIKRCDNISNSFKEKERKNKYDSSKVLSLHLSGNPSIGDAGAAALAAALRIVNQDNPLSHPILDTLDLSSCDISDIGAEALSLALEGAPGCIRRLILCNNRISDKGASFIGNALNSAVESSELFSELEYLNLDNNKDLGDQGAAAVASAMESGVLKSASLRSCSIGADGSLAFGKVLPKLAFVNKGNTERKINCHIDLSGNQLGVYRPPKKKKGTSLLKSKASATTASYFNFIGKKIKGGLKDVTGVDVSQYISPPSAESDDDFEESNEFLEQKKKDNVALEDMMTSAKCGARALADCLINWDGQKEIEGLGSSESSHSIGMRLCSLDKGGVDALAALVIEAKNKLGLNLKIDISMNPALDEHDVEAFNNNNIDNESLKDMAKRHLDALEALRVAQERAAEASSGYNNWGDESLWNEEYGDDASDEIEDFGYDQEYDNQFDNDFEAYDVDDSYEGGD